MVQPVASKTGKEAPTKTSIRALLHRVKKPARPDAAAVAEKNADENKRRVAAEEQRTLIKKAEHDAARENAKKPAPKDAKAAKPDEPIVRPKKPKRRRRTIRELLLLAGVSDEPAAVTKRIVRIAFFIILAVQLLTLIVAGTFGGAFDSTQHGLGYLGFSVALWTAGLAGAVVAVGIGYAVWLDIKIDQRRKEIELVFPDYLQLAAANLAAGMTIDRALWSAVRPRFGVLAKEMEDVAKKTMTGYDLERSLQEFSHKYDSLVIKRAIDLICEGTRSGGRMADILNKIAVNIQENTILQKEMSANVTTYVIFISFASVLASPFLFGLATQLLAVIQSIAGTLAATGGSGSSSTGLSLSSNAVNMSDFRTFSIVVLGITSTMSACIVSVIRKGNVKDGLKTIPAFFLISIALYFIATWALGSLFSGFFAT